MSKSLVGHFSAESKHALTEVEPLNFLKLKLEVSLRDASDSAWSLSPSGRVSTATIKERSLQSMGRQRSRRIERDSQSPGTPRPSTSMLPKTSAHRPHEWIVNRLVRGESCTKFKLVGVAADKQARFERENLPL
jgi:hypothetical protein